MTGILLKDTVGDEVMGYNVIKHQVFVKRCLLELKLFILVESFK